MILPGNLLGIALVLFLFVDNATHGASMWRSLQRGTVPAWSVDEVDHLARFLGAQGMSQTSAARHLWISQSDEVVKHLMNFLPETDEKPYTGPDFLVLKPSGPIPELPQGWSAIPLGWGRQALVHTFYSQLDMAPLHVKVAVEGSEERQVNTTKLEWQANEERGRIGLSGSAMRDTDTVTYQLDRTPPRSTRIFLPILPEDRPRMRVVSAAGATPCHVALDREHSVVLAGSLIHFPDLIEIEPRDRDFLKGALPELDWTGCL